MKQSSKKVEKMDACLINEKFDILPEDLKKEVLDFIDFLILKKEKEKKPEPFDFTWEGGLRDIKAKYRAVDLQHEAMKWR